MTAIFLRSTQDKTFVSKGFRQAFTMLELIIALLLLGVLSALAWSILDSFQNAEQRGWKLSTKLQTIRSARLWLEEDLQHVAPPLPSLLSSANSFAARNQTVSLEGSSSGFTVRYAPSIDPLPWLEELLVGSADTASLPPGLQSASRLGLFPVEANYRVSGSTSLTKTIRSLAPSQLSRDDRSASDEPLRTTADLYRNVDPSSSQANPTNILSTSTLESLYRVRFRYSDGTNWKSSWTNGGNNLPKAIELSFDLDAPQDLVDNRDSSPIKEDESSALASEQLAEQIDEPTVEVDDDVAAATLQEPRQIRIVVQLPWVLAAQRSGDLPSSNNADESEPNGTTDSFPSPSSFDSSFLDWERTGGSSS
jgi:prepilin-type N-terminal cleavage/methylation domain-containing protein